jgi:hypothetical protein
LGERWCGASRRTARQAAPAAAPLLNDEKERRKTRRRQIDQIVKPRGSPAEGRVAWCAVADHTVGRVDGLVEYRPREPADDHPDDRRYDCIGEIFREALDGRARDAGGFEPFGVAADNVRYGITAGCDAVLLQRAGDVRHVPVQAPLCDERAGKQADNKNPEAKV